MSSGQPIVAQKTQQRLGVAMCHPKRSTKANSNSCRKVAARSTLPPVRTKKNYLIFLSGGDNLFFFGGVWDAYDSGFIT